MDENDYLKPGKLFRIKPKDSLDRLSYRLSMSLKQADDHYIVDELFHNENVTIYALYDVDHKLDLTSKGNIKNEQVGDGMNIFKNDLLQNRIQSSNYLSQNSNLKKIEAATSKHIEGEKIDQDVQTDTENSEGKNKQSKEPAELKILYCRQFKDSERKHRTNRFKTKGICTDVNEALSINAMMKKDSCTVVNQRGNLNLKVESRRNSSIYYSSSSSNKETEKLRKKDRKLLDVKERLDSVSESSETEFVNFLKKEMVGPKKSVRINTVPYEVSDQRESSACFSLKGFRSSLVSINEGKELQFSRTYPEDANVQNAILKDMKCLQLQLNRVVALLENQLITSCLFLPHCQYSNKAVNTKESEENNQLISSRLLVPNRQYSDKAISAKGSNESNQLISAHLLVPDVQYSDKAISAKGSYENNHLIGSNLLQPDRQYSDKAISTIEFESQHIISAHVLLPTYSNKAIGTEESVQIHHLISSRSLPPERHYSSKAVSTTESLQSHHSEPARPKILSYDDIPVFSLMNAIPAQKEFSALPHKREITVHVAMSEFTSSTALVLNGNVVSISEERRSLDRANLCRNSSSDISIQILTRCKNLGLSKSDSGSIRPSIGSTTSLRKSVSYSRDFQGSGVTFEIPKEETPVEKVVASCAVCIIYWFTKKVLFLESFSCWEFVLECEDAFEENPPKGTTATQSEATTVVTSKDTTIIIAKETTTIIPAPPPKPPTPPVPRTPPTPTRKGRKIPIWKHSTEKKKLHDFPRPASPQKSVAHRNNARLPWNNSLQKTTQELLRKNLMSKSKALDPFFNKEDELKSKGSSHGETNKKSTNAIKKISGDSSSGAHNTQGMKVIHSNKSYLDLMKSNGKDLGSERSKKHVLPHACVNVAKDKKIAGQFAKQSIKDTNTKDINTKVNANFIVLPENVYEKVIYVRESNMKEDDSSSEFEESLLGREQSCSCVKASKSEDSRAKSQIVISNLKSSKDKGIILTGKQSLPEIGKYEDECFVPELSQRCSDGFQKGKKNSQVARSIWALTKVLIFDDGTKKVEVLEASCEPLSPNTEEKNRI